MQNPGGKKISPNIEGTADGEEAIKLYQKIVNQI